MGPTKDVAKNIIQGLVACDELSGLNLFPGLRVDQDACGPDPRDFFAVVEPHQVPEECLSRFQKLVLARVPRGITIRGVDITENIVKVASFKKWIQLNICEFMQVEEVRIQGRWGVHKRVRHDGVVDADADAMNEDEEDASCATTERPLKRPAAAK